MSEDTWTLAELSRITGLDYETVKFYARPVNAKTKGSGVTHKGGGVIRETKTVNGRRQFDAEALFDLYISGLLKSTGASLEAIRVANESRDYPTLIDCQLAEIQKKKNELERQESKLRAIRNLTEGFENETKLTEQLPDLAKIIQCRYLEYAQAACDEMGLKIDVTDLIGASVPIKPCEVPHGAPIEELNALTTIALSNEIDEHSISSAEGLLNNEKLRSFKEAFTGIIEMANDWQSGIKPSDPIFAKPVKEALATMENLFGPEGRQYLPKAIDYILLSDLIGVLLELGSGKGITSCLREAITYWSNHDE